MSSEYDCHWDEAPEEFCDSCGTPLQHGECWVCRVDCGLGRDGQCSKAGSEECDFECAASHGPLYGGSPGWAERHDGRAPIEGCDCNECYEALERIRRINERPKP